MGLVRSAGVRAGAAALVAAGALVVTDGGAAATTFTIPATAKYIQVSLRGNGHGHGLSQYGAYGAAMAGKTYRQILAFYYPSTTLTTAPSTSIRVRLSGTGTTLRVRAESGLTVSKVGALSASGISYYRLLADSAGGETLQALKTGATTWTTVARGLPNRSGFSRGAGHSTRVRLTDGTETRYFGILRAVRNSTTSSTAGLFTVNVVNLNSYARGVVPREMPSSWDAAAVSAQAVAARTYGRYGMEHPASSEYDLCDTSMCQVYGGYLHYAANGTLLWRDDPAAVSDNQDQVLTYGGHAIFAQFSASNGGWTTDGGQPYLVAKQDPYDAAQGADPYTLQQSKAVLSVLAAQFGLAKLTAIAITLRDGNGTGTDMWGGRVLAGYVTGTKSDGSAAKVSFDGYRLQNAVNMSVADIYVGTTWLNFGATS